MAERSDEEPETVDQPRAATIPVAAEQEEVAPEKFREPARQPATESASEEIAQSPEAGQDSPADLSPARAARPKPDPVRTLVDLFTIKGANASKLLRELEKGTSWRFADEDVEAALALLPEHDPRLARTRQLLHEAIETRDGRFARAAGDFAIGALTAELEGLPSWPPGANSEPVIALQELAQRLGSDLRDPKRQRRTHNALMIAVDLLSNRGGLAFEIAAPVLREALGRPPEYERDRSNPRRHRMASVTLPRNDLERVRDLLDLLQPWELELEDAVDAERRASSEARAARQAADDADHRADRLAAEVAELRAELEGARQEAEVSRDRVQDVRIHASADVTELRARSVAFLNTRLRDLLATAKEASEVEPPRTATAVRLLEQAIQELRKEVEWLRSSV